MTQALILAAGRGSRLLDLTHDRPKCMVEVCGYPILKWVIDSLHQNGIDRITIIGGYRHEALPTSGLNVIVNGRWAETNMVSTLRCASSMLRAEETIISYSDILYHPGIVATLLSCRDDIAITFDRKWRTLWEERFTDPLSDAESFRQESGALVEIGARASSLEDIKGQFMGLLKVTSRGWAQIESYLSGLSSLEVDRLDTTSLLSRLVARGVRIAAIGVDGHWCEIDGPADRNLAERHCASSVAWSHDWRSQSWLSG